MSNYYVHRSGEDEYLEHSIFQKGVRGSHKYIARMNIGGKMRYFYDPRELAVFKAGGRALGGARKAVGGAGKAVGGAIANVRRNASSFVDRHITGASAKRAAAAERKRWKTQESNYNNSGARSRATRAKKNSEAYERKYNKSLFGRIENAGKRIANAGSSARKAMGNAAGQASRAGKNFAGSISKAAYNAPGAVRRGVDRHITGASAKRAAAAERKRWKTQESNYNNSGARSRATRAKKNSEAYERKYNKSLFGRVDTAMDNVNDMLKRGKRKGKKKK